MMKYLLLLILPFLSNAAVNGFIISPDALTGNNSLSFNSENHATGAVYAKDSHVLLEERLNDVFENAFIVAPNDTFPIQVGAYKNKSNADKIYRGIKDLTDIEVRIVVEDGLYKVRIGRFPEGILFNGNYIAALSNQQKGMKKADLVSDPIVDSARYNFENTAFMTISDKSEVPCDTVFIWGELIYFKGNTPWLKRIKYFGESFALVNALIITILFSIFTMITLLIIILMNRRRMEREEKLRPYLNGEISESYSRFPLWHCHC